MAGMVMIPVKETYLNADPGSGNMIILKEEPDAKRYFMMFVGDAEFAAIAKEKGLVEPQRPLTHDLYLRILEKLNVTFIRVEVHDVKENTFFANVVFSAEGKEHVVDSRPSDAVALALSRKIPILVNEKLFHRELSQEEMQEFEGLVKSVKF
jgi:bifunctional DNase/RNase